MFALKRTWMSKDCEVGLFRHAQRSPYAHFVCRKRSVPEFNSIWTDTRHPTVSFPFVIVTLLYPCKSSCRAPLRLTTRTRLNVCIIVIVSAVQRRRCSTRARGSICTYAYRMNRSNGYTFRLISFPSANRTVRLRETGGSRTAYTEHRMLVQVLRSHETASTVLTSNEYSSITRVAGNPA